jgi:hypothetical protein
LVPITEEMKKGKAPLRSFGDLLQFYELKHDEPADGAAAPPPAEAPVVAENKDVPPAVENKDVPVAAENNVGPATQPPT